MPNAWDRLENEPEVWYRRFQTFLELPPKRSVRAAYFEGLKNVEKSSKKGVPPEWYKKADEYDWHNRAAAYDEYLVAKQRSAFEEAAMANARSRMEILEALDSAVRMLYTEQTKIVQHGQELLKNVNPATEEGLRTIQGFNDDWRKRFADLSELSAKLMREARIEFGLPTERTETKAESKVEVSGQNATHIQFIEVVKDYGPDHTTD